MTCREMALSEDYVDILLDYQITREIFGEMEVELCSVPAGQGMYVVYVNRNVPVGGSSSLYVIPQCFGLMAEGSGGGRSFDTFALTDTGIRQTQLPPLSLTGRGVVMGFLDTGIRYEEEVFRYSDGTTRILSIWDQTIQEGEPPEGQIFGTEYKREEINAALASENPRQLVPTTDTIGHGTALASVAAGSNLLRNRQAGSIADGTAGGGMEFLGAAPDAEIVVVKLREAKEYLRDFRLIPKGAHAYSESDILLALKYLDSFAINLRRPLVVCFGIGTSQGSHTGKSILSRYMQNMLESRSRSIVVCGGNEGNSAGHFEGNTCVRRGEPYEDVEIRVAENTAGFVAEIWGRIPQSYTVSIISPGGEAFPSGMGTLGQNFRHRFLYEKSTVNVIYNLVEEGSGEERILIRFEQPAAGIWTIRVFGVGECTNDNFHIWLPIRNFRTEGTYFLKPTPYTTLTVPSYAEEIITVSTYNDENHSFWPESGRGFGKNGEISPSISAPGVDIPTINGRMSGSSMAAALTAGAAAQFLQWAVVERNEEFVFGRDVRNYLIRGAVREENLSYPNREWGDNGIIVSSE